MNIKTFIQHSIFLVPVVLTSLVYLGHGNGDGSGLVLYGKPNQTLGLWLFSFQIIFTLFFLILLHVYNEKFKGSFVFLGKLFIFLVSLGIPIFVNDWVYCGIFCYIATSMYIVISACILLLVVLFSLHHKHKNQPLEK